MKYIIMFLYLVLAQIIYTDNIQARLLADDTQFISNDTTEYKRPQTGRTKNGRRGIKGPIKNWRR